MAINEDSGRGRNYTPESGLRSWARSRASPAVWPAYQRWEGETRGQAKDEGAEARRSQGRGAPNKPSRSQRDHREQGRRPANHPSRRKGRGRRRATNDKQSTRTGPPAEAPRPHPKTENKGRGAGAPLYKTLILYPLRACNRGRGPDYTK